jgi:DNA-binding transcriptional ArsR family regulator
MRRGADDYLTKPFKTSDLLTTVNRVLEEAKFKACKAVLDTDSTFNAMANPIRREILQLLSAKGKYRFMDLTRELGIEDHTKVNFHLKVLKENGLVAQDEQKFYCLSVEGEKVTQCLNVVINNLTS